ncbi:B12-binding domain-containing radical SAM protein, partial [Chloroflexota bacterium]
MTGHRSLPMIVSRGCPFNCNFCYRNFGHKIKYRTVEKVIKEVEELKAAFHIDYIVLWDELPLFDKEWSKNFALALISSSLRILWTCPGRAASVTNSDFGLLKLLKQSGLRRISFGIESGSNDMLKVMNKGLTVQQGEQALRITRKADIKATATFMIGYPGETHTTIEESVNFCKKNLLRTTFYICVALPGTKLYRDCIEKGLIKGEEKYLYTVSRRGDASQLNINLTEMSDHDFLGYKRNAEKAVNRFYFFNHIKYFGIVGGIFSIVNNLFLSIRRRLKGTY